MCMCAHLYYSMFTLIPFRIYSDFLVVIPFLLIQTSLARPLPTCSHRHRDKHTCRPGFSHSDQQPFMLLDYCCRCCGFTLIKRHGPFSLKSTPSDTWVRTMCVKWGDCLCGSRAWSTAGVFTHMCVRVNRCLNIKGAMSVFPHQLHVICCVDMFLLILWL